MSDWTDVILDDLKAQLVSGLSYTQIAAALNQSHGTAFSRSAVMGKAHRAGLASSKVGAGPRPPRRAFDKIAEGLKDAIAIARGEKEPGRLFVPREIKVGPPSIIEVEDADIPAAQRKTLLELTNESCRWPIGDVGTPGFFFCGSPKADFTKNIPYCPCHMAISTNRYPRGHSVSDEASVKLRILMRRRFHSKAPVGGVAA